MPPRSNVSRVGCPNIPFPVPFLKQISDDHQYPDDPFVALADFKVILEKATKRTVHELLRKTPGSQGTKLLIASTAVRANRNRHLGTLMPCCEAWEPVGQCFDQCSFECTDLQGLSQIIASLTRQRNAEREAEICNLPWTQTEKDNALANYRLGLRGWRTKKEMLCLHAVDEDGHTLENEDESGRRPCEYWSKIFEARVEGERHHCHETILGYVQKAPDDIQWVIDQNEFDELMATNKESAPGPDGIPYSLHRCAGGLGSTFLFKVYQHILAGGLVLLQFAASRTVFIPKSSEVDNNGFIVRSPDALRPLTLLNCDCKILTTAICRGLQWYTMRCIHPSQRCISSRQMTDNIFEVETTALAHVACSPQESGILLTNFAAAYPSVNHSWIFHVLEKAEFICRFLRMIYCNSTTQIEFAGTSRGLFLMARASDKVVRRAASYLQWRSIPSFVGSRTRSSQETLPPQTFFSLLRALMLMILQWLLRPFVC